jgi:hypothetical protein
VITGGRGHRACHPIVVCHSEAGHWLKAADYLSLDVLRQALDTIFSDFGTYFMLDFKEREIDEKLILT